MRYQLWIHRDVEILQNLITRYTYSSLKLRSDRVHIEWEWNNIKKDMDLLLKEVDEHVALVKRDKEVSVSNPETRD